MRHALLLAAALATLAAAAHAAPPGEPPPQGPGGAAGPGGGPGGGPPGGGLFIAPDGEPFRQGDGRAAWFAGADADHNGSLALAEFRADAMRFFKALDVDGDGMISGKENQLYETKIAPEITRMSLDSQRGGRGGGGPGGGLGGGGPPGGGPPGGGKRAMKGGPIAREGAARFSMLNEPQPVRGADANLDYRITADEWARTAGKRFSILDKDGDGRLTLETLPKAPAMGPPDGGKRKKGDQGRPPPG